MKYQAFAVVNRAAHKSDPSWKVCSIFKASRRRGQSEVVVPPSARITLELRNLGETPLTLYPGETIGQLFFRAVIGVGDDAGAAAIGQYGGSVDLLPKHVSSKVTRAKLEKLRRAAAK